MAFGPSGVLRRRGFGGGVALGDDAAFGDLLLQRLAEHLGRYLGEFVRVEEEVVFERPAVAALLGLRLERVGDRGARAEH